MDADAIRSLDWITRLSAPSAYVMQMQQSPITSQRLTPMIPSMKVYIQRPAETERKAAKWIDTPPNVGEQRLTQKGKP